MSGGPEAPPRTGMCCYLATEIRTTRGGDDGLYRCGCVRACCLQIDLLKSVNNSCRTFCTVILAVCRAKRQFKDLFGLSVSAHTEELFAYLHNVHKIHLLTQLQLRVVVWIIGPVLNYGVLQLEYDAVSPSLTGG